MKAVTTYRQRRPNSLRDRVRRGARNAAIRVLSLGHSIPKTGNWIRFPYYHHIFDDERRGFQEHLRYLRRFGDFISMDDAAAYLQTTTPPAGRYFCVTFDDGLKNSLTNATPILLDSRAVAAFFVPTGFVGTSVERDSDMLAGFYQRLISPPVEMMSWDDCRRLVDAGMTVGSHGVSHTRLKELSAEDVERELLDSKIAVEKNLGIECRHFCPPFGMPVLDFEPAREPQIAKRVGYQTFLTTRRGSVNRRPSPFNIERDLVVAAWPTWQLRFFMSH